MAGMCIYKQALETVKIEGVWIFQQKCHTVGDQMIEEKARDFYLLLCWMSQDKLGFAATTLISVA